MGSRAAAPGPTDTGGLTPPRPSPLVRAALGSTPAARLSAWREWREAADLDHLSVEEFQTIPCLGGDLAAWLAPDPASGILRGMMRRAWTANQVRLNLLADTVAALEGAGCGPVMAAGSAAIALVHRRQGSVRPIHDLRVAVQRQHLGRAAEVLESAGWRRRHALPESHALDWAAASSFTREEVPLLLQWRVLPVTGDAAQACEAEFWRRAVTVEERGTRWRVPGAEHALLAAMCGRFGFDSDPIHWAVDTALLPIENVDWKLWRKLAAEFAPEAFERLEWMRQSGWRAPRITPPPKPRPPMRQAIRAEYRRWRGRAGRVLRRIGLR